MEQSSDPSESDACAALAASLERLREAMYAADATLRHASEVAGRTERLLADLDRGSPPRDPGPEQQAGR